MSMGFSFEQNQRMEQKQILSQRMIQSMELLQLPLQKLEERIEQELQTNPVLERVAEGETGGEESVSDENAEEAPVYEKESEIEIRDGDERNDFVTADEFAEAYKDTIDERPVRSQNWLDRADERYHDQMANLASRGETLQEHLLAQLAWYDLPKKIAALCEKIIWNLDANGRLTAPLEGKSDPLAYFLLSDAPSASDRADANQALDIVRRLEPLGVGAFNATETLLLQLVGDDSITEAARTLLTDYVADLENNRLGQIEKKTGWPPEKIEGAIRRIRGLNPHPAAGFNERPAATVIPDLFVEKNTDGRWVVHAEENPLFNLRVSPEYRALSRSKETDRKAKEYLRRNIGSAQWLIDAVAQRRATLLSVSQAIVDHQTEFFESGPEKLRPLKMQQIADSVGVHVATVSRACDDKWLLSPRGVFPLKRFFTGAIARKSDAENDNAESLAAETVKERLRVLVEAEDKKKPLSDEELVAALAAEGIVISRRTIAKYRDVLHIPSSRGRKEWK